MTVVWTLVACYVALLLVRPALGPHDDYTLLRTLQSGKPFPLWWRDWNAYDVGRLGRFSPLVGSEYNLVALVSRTPRAYYALNCLELIGFVWLLSRLF